MTQEEREAARLQRREEMKRLLLEGVPVNDIVEQLRAGRDTVYKVRAELIAAGELGDTCATEHATDTTAGEGEGEGEGEPTVRVATRYLTALEALLDTVVEVHRLRRALDGVRS